jgi:hypothetical protein
MADKRTFTVDKLRTDEICGITGGDVTICGIDAASLANINAEYISGHNLIVSGDGNSLVDMRSGVFDELYISGVKYLPRQQIAYAFRFGGPPVEVPIGLPYVTGSNPQLYTGLHSGTNAVFVNDQTSFVTGDHVLIGGLFDESEIQEQHTVSGILYYQPDDCCNAEITDNQGIGTNQIIHDDGSNFIVGSKVKIDDHNQVYDVVDSDVYEASSNTRYINITPALTTAVLGGESCICLVKPTLLMEDNLQHDYPVGTKLANKHAHKTETIIVTQESEEIGDPYYDKVSIRMEPDVVDEFLGQVEFAYTDELDFGAGDFTVEAIVYGNSFTNWDGIFGVWYDREYPGKQSFLLYEHPSENGTIIGEVMGLTPDNPYNADGITIADPTKVLISTTAIEDGKTYHVALQRKDGIYLQLWVNGVKEDEIVVPSTASIPVADPRIFRVGNWGGNFGDYDYVKRVRATKGIARYVSDFSPNYTDPYPTFKQTRVVIDW